MVFPVSIFTRNSSNNMLLEIVAGKTKDPDVPDDPLEPDDPELPLVPATPLDPDVPLDPDEPEVPLVPELPLDPDVPDDPDEPDVPDEPELPLVPDVPDEPDEPEVPLVPELPLEPDVPELPEAPIRVSLVILYVIVSPVLFATTKKPVVSPVAGKSGSWDIFRSAIILYYCCSYSIRLFDWSFIIAPLSNKR